MTLRLMTLKLMTFSSMTLSTERGIGPKYNRRVCFQLNWSYLPFPSSFSSETNSIYILAESKCPYHTSPSLLHFQHQLSLFVILALPPPPHGRATTPLRGERKRILNYPNTPIQDRTLPIQDRTLPPDDSQALAPVLTRDPMVVMDRGERNR